MNVNASLLLESNYMFLIILIILAPCNITEDMVVKHFKETELARNLMDLMSSKDVVVISGI